MLAVWDESISGLHARGNNGILFSIYMFNGIKEGRKEAAMSCMAIGSCRQLPPLTVEATCLCLCTHDSMWMHGRGAN